jgi:hypothetical protein
MIRNESWAVTGRVLANMLKSARSGRKRFYDSGLEIARYGYSPDYGFEYQNLPKDAFFRAKVALTSETIRVFGPMIYPSNPHRTASSKPWATPEMQRVTDLVGDYLNWTPAEFDLFGSNRRMIDEALSWGRGVSLTQRDPRSGHIQTVYKTVRHLLLDPDARSWADCRYGAIKERMTRNEARALWPEGKWDILPKDRGGSDKDTLPWESSVKSGADIVTFWRVWVKTNLYDQEGGGELLKIDRAEDPMITAESKRPICYLCDEDGKLVLMSPWEVPFHLDDEFPFTVTDFYPHADCIWPVSPLEPGMGYQRAINWIVTLMMGKYRFTSRTVGAIIKQNGEGLSDANLDKMLIGGDIEIMQIETKGEAKTLKELIGEFNWSHDYLVHGTNLLQTLEERFQKAVGLFNILYAGEAGSQSRSATDAAMRDRNSMSRINDMRLTCERAQTAIARKEAMAARYLLSREQIGTVLGPDAARDWGFLVQPGADVVSEMTIQALDAGLPMEDATAFAQQKAKEAVDPERWLLETDYGIEADSMKRQDINQRIESQKELISQVVPAQIQSPDLMEKAMAYKTLATYHQTIGNDASLVKSMFAYAAQLEQMALAPPPPMPPEMPA